MTDSDADAWISILLYEDVQRTRKEFREAPTLSPPALTYDREENEEVDK